MIRSSRHKPMQRRGAPVESTAHPEDATAAGCEVSSRICQILKKYIFTYRIMTLVIMSTYENTNISRTNLMDENEIAFP